MPPKEHEVCSTRNPGFASLFPQSKSVCLLLQIQSYLAKIRDPEKKQTDVVKVKVFEGRFHGPLTPFTSLIKTISFSRMLPPHA